MRSFDRSMPEELNRVLTDHASDLLLCSTPTAVENLEREAAVGEAHLVGDVMADVSLAFRDIARGALGRRSRSCGLEPGAYLRRDRAPCRQRRRPEPPAEALVELLERCPGRSCSRSIRARARGSRRRASMDRLAGPDAGAAARLPRLPRARPPRPRRAHRLRRCSEGGVPARRALRDAARHAPSGSRRWRPAGTCSSTSTPAPRWRRWTGGRPRSGPSCTAAGTPLSALPRSSRLHCAPMRDRGRRARLRRTAACRGVLRGGPRGGRRRRGHARGRRRSRRGDSHIEDVPDETLAAVAGSAARDDALRGPRQGGRRDRRGAHAAHPESRARPAAAVAARQRARRTCSRRASSWCSSRPPTPGTTRERSCRLLEESGLAAGRDFYVAFSPERDRPGPHRLHAAHDPQGRGRADRRVPRARRRPVRDGLRRGGPGLDARGGRAHEAAREHLPLGQHRARQRAGDALRPHGHRRLGGRSTRRPPSRTGSCPSSRGREWAATACRSTPSTSPGGRASSTCRPSSSSWPARSTRRMPYFCVETIVAGAERPLEVRSRARGSAIVGVSYKAGVGDLRESPGAEDHAAAARARRRALLPRRLRARAAATSASSESAWPRGAPTAS